MNSIFLIEELWLDWMENTVAAARGYDPAGYVETEEEAKSIVEKGGLVPKDACWALHQATPRFRYKEVYRFVSK